jgi:hypothetical protein
MGSHENGVKGAIRYATEMINARGKINFDHEGWKRFPHQAQYILEQGIFRKWSAEDLEVTVNSVFCVAGVLYSSICFTDGLSRAVEKSAPGGRKRYTFWVAVK